MNLAETGEWITGSAAVAIISTHRRSFNMGEALMILKSACSDGSIRCRDRGSMGWVLVPSNAWQHDSVYLNVGDTNAEPDWWGVPDGVQVSRDDLEAHLVATSLAHVRDIAEPVTLEGAIRQLLDGNEREPWKIFCRRVRKLGDKADGDPGRGWSDRNIRRKADEILKRLNRPK